MRKTLFLALLFSIVFTGCKKNDAEPQITGVSNMTVAAGFLNKAVLTISGTDGKPKKTDLSVNGLPAGVTASFSKENEVPDFETTLTIEADETAKAGIYPVKLIANTSSGKTKSYDLNLTVRETCDFFTGKYSATYSSNYLEAPKLADNSVEIEKDPTNPDKLIIHNVLYDGTRIVASRYCGTKIFDTDPYQKITNGMFAENDVLDFLGGFTTSGTAVIEIFVIKDNVSLGYRVNLIREE